MAFLVIFALFFGFAVPIAAFVALARTVRLRRELEALQVEFAARPELPSRAVSTSSPLSPGGDTASLAPAKDAVRRTIIPRSSHRTEPPSEATTARSHPDPEPSPNQPAAAIATALRRAAVPRDDSRWSFEDRLASRWLVWLGAVALALGGVFFVKYSIEQGLLQPSVRVILGLMSGALLVLAGEWARRRWRTVPVQPRGPDYVPSALAAAGVSMAFGSTFAAQALYDLVTPAVGFVGLALISVAAVALSLLHGPLVAAVGIVGAYLVPALARSDASSAWVLFGYLIVVAAAAVTLVGYKDWHWLAWCSLALALAWPLTTILFAPGSSAPLPVALYLGLLFALHYLLHLALLPVDIADDADSLFDAVRHSDGHRLLLAAAAGTMTCLFLLSLDQQATEYAAVSAGLLAGLFILAAYIDRRLDLLLLPGAIGLLSILAAWTLPTAIAARQPIVWGNIPAGFEAGPIVPPELLPFAMAAVAYGGGFLLACGSAAPRLRRTGYWAAVSVIVALSALVVAYAKIRHFDADIVWAAVAFALAAVFVFATRLLVARSDDVRLGGAIAANAVGVVATLALALTMSLREAWLSVALALLILGVALVHRRLPLDALRRLAGILGGVVIARLAANPSIFDYALESAVPGINWILYGYGIPALAFWLAARMLARQKNDHAVAILEAGTLVFSVLLVSLEIRQFVGDGALSGRSYTLFEQSLHSVAWLAGAYALYRRDPERSGVVVAWGWKLLAGAAALQVLLMQVLASNPLLTGESVWEPPIANLMLLAYGLPAALAVLIHRTAISRGHGRVAMIAGVSALVLAFVEVSLEVRHAFQGAVLKGGVTTDAEWYAYSVAWLAYAGVLLSVGIGWQAFALRQASLILVLVTVCKVFLWDMSETEGLFRAGSFLALGLCLVGIGFVYRRFLWKPAS